MGPNERYLITVFVCAIILALGLRASWYLFDLASRLRASRLVTQVKEETKKMIGVHRKPSICEHNGRDNLPSDAKRHIYDNNKCPNCCDGELIGGPCGGGSQNYYCEQCGSGFNLTGGFGDHMIGVSNNIWTAKFGAHRNKIRNLFLSRGIETFDDNWGLRYNGAECIWLIGSKTFYLGRGEISDNVVIKTYNGKTWDCHELSLADPHFLDKVVDLLDGSKKYHQVQAADACCGKRP